MVAGTDFYSEYGGEIVHDPALDDSGIVGPCDDGRYWITYFGSAVATDSPRAG